MLRPILWAIVLISSVLANGDFVVLYSPESIVLQDQGEHHQSALRDVLSATLGLTTTSESTWSGMLTANPFVLPNAVVIVAVEGVEHLAPSKHPVFLLDDDEMEEITWQGISGTLETRKMANGLFRMRLAAGFDNLGESALGTLKPAPIDESSLKLLNPKVKKDGDFLEEIKLLNAITKTVPVNMPDNENRAVYWFVVSSLKDLVDVYGKDSPTVQEALIILNNALSNVTEAFKSGYKNKVLIAAFTNNYKGQNNPPETLSRKRRANEADDNDKNVKDAENTTSTPVTESVKNDEEGIGKSEDEEAERKTIDEGSSLKKSEETVSVNESSKESSGNSGTEANEARDSSTVRSGHEPEDETRNNEQSNTDTENTNRTVEVKDLKLAKRYSADYPVIFNILLWFGVIFFFSLLAICITIADMDPGRDSIIYRMTSARMKKDN